MILRCPLSKMEKRRVVETAIEAVLTIYSGNGTNILENLGKEWLELSREIVDIYDKNIGNLVDYRAEIYILEKKRTMILELIKEFEFPGFPESFIDSIIETDEICTYDIIKKVLSAYFDLKKGGSRPKVLAALKASIASDMYYFGFSKLESQKIASTISWALFGDDKGVDFPRKSKTYKNKFITLDIVNWDEYR